MSGCHVWYVSSKSQGEGDWTFPIVAVHLSSSDQIRSDQIRSDQIRCMHVLVLMCWFCADVCLQLVRRGTDQLSLSKAREVPRKGRIRYREKRLFWKVCSKNSSWMMLCTSTENPITTDCPHS